jgi:predicted transcriptional regulator
LIYFGQFHNHFFIGNIQCRKYFIFNPERRFFKMRLFRDFMKGSRVAPSSNPNSYPMTDEAKFPAAIKISINGKEVKIQTLPDDPADHRGVLSWSAQPQDRKLREAGSYGYLIKIGLDQQILDELNSNRKLTIRIATTDEGGLAIYGKDFGRYPFDPSLVFWLK